MTFEENMAFDEGYDQGEKDMKYFVIQQIKELKKVDIKQTWGNQEGFRNFRNGYRKAIEHLTNELLKRLEK